MPVFECLEEPILALSQLGGVIALMFALLALRCTMWILAAFFSMAGSFWGRSTKLDLASMNRRS